MFFLAACGSEPGTEGSRQVRADVGWISPGSGLETAARARALLAAFERAPEHGLDTADYRPANMAGMLAAAARSPEQAARLNDLLSDAYVRWATDLAVSGRARHAVIATDPLVRAPVPDANSLLSAARLASDVDAYLQQLEQRHPVYNRLHAALAAELKRGVVSARIALLQQNLDRARALPVSGRHILVDAGSQRLWFYENGKIVGDMRVVVGAPGNPTPMMAGLIDHVVYNPYWNVPEDLAQQRIAPKVVAEGTGYLARHGYQVLSDWTDAAVSVNATAIDWKAAAAERESVRVRQLPGPGNMMGRMKFMFANDLGIYLHDTPERGLFLQRDRARSAGCVRVQDWRRLAAWLFDGKVPDTGKSVSPETEARLPRPVPVHISYFTVDLGDEGLRAIADIYRRDGL